jgi:hypothetical protein
MKITLGAVQFGMNYSILNVYGKTTTHEVEKILRYAYSSGINSIERFNLYLKHFFNHIHKYICMLIKSVA